MPSKAQSQKQVQNTAKNNKVNVPRPPKSQKPQNTVKKAGSSTPKPPMPRKRSSAPKQNILSKAVNRGSKATKTRITENHYLNTLMDPEDVVGVKIPDVNFQESGTLHVRQVLRTNTNSNGLASCFVGQGALLGVGTCEANLIPNIADLDCGNNPNLKFAVGMRSAGSSALTEAAPFDVTLTPNGLDGFTMGDDVGSTQSWDAISSITKNMRLVSASIKAEYAGAPLNAAGFTMVGSFPKDFFDSQNIISSYSASQLANLEYCDSHPTSEGPLEATWAPSDLSTLNYQDVEAQTTDDLLRGLGTLVALVTGAPASTPVQFTICYNLEYLPLPPSLSIGISPSPVDRDALDEALNHLEHVELCHDADLTHDVNVQGATTIGSGQLLTGSAEEGCNIVQYGVLSHGNKAKPATSKKKSQKSKKTKQGSMFSQLESFVVKLAKKYGPQLLESGAAALAL